MATGVITIIAENLRIAPNTDNHISTDWQLSDIADFSNIIHQSLNDTNNLLTYVHSYVGTDKLYARARFTSDSETSDWTPAEVIVDFMPVVIAQPVISIGGEPYIVSSGPTLKTEPFAVLEGYDTHQSTDWILTDNGTNTVIWESLNDAVNLIEITLPQNTLVSGGSYTLEVIHYGTVNSASNTHSFNKLNTQADLWTSLSRFTPHGLRSNMGYCYYNGDLYIAGGYYSSTNYLTIEKVDFFNGNNEVIANLPVPLSGCGMGIYNDNIYLVAGRIAEARRTTNAILKYNLQTKVWTTVEPFPYTITPQRTLLLSNNKIAMLVYSASNSYLYFYDMATETSSRSAVKYQNLSIVQDIIELPDGKIAYGCGRYSSNYLFVYDPVTDTWETKTSPPTGNTASVYTPLPNGKLLVVWAGRKVKIYDPVADTWSNGVVNLEDRTYRYYKVIDNKYLLIATNPTYPTQNAFDREVLEYGPITLA